MRKVILEYLLQRLRINIHILKLSQSRVELLKFKDLQQAINLIESQQNMINIMNICLKILV
jgi:spore coat polysaccharide biosynthesis predicted glycosyltransferase SpsG